jgi:hypothetical protein
MPARAAITQAAMTADPLRSAADARIPDAISAPC